jgi:hypothetical protein
LERLFSYCIPVDDGAAPNPYWGYCTLAICKPGIRRAAQVGDWVIGTGSRRSPIGDVSRHLVYAMQITDKLRMEEYDAWAKCQCPRKIPQWTARDHRHRLGDAIYDFCVSPPSVRDSVHGEHNRRRDLSGKFVLISNSFIYWGDRPKRLPRALWPLAQQRQGHRSHSNAALLKPFLKWFDSLDLRRNSPLGKPQVQVFADRSQACQARKKCH